VTGCCMAEAQVAVQRSTGRIAALAVETVTSVPASVAIDATAIALARILIAGVLL
jgi:hypothetical protein